MKKTIVIITTMLMMALYGCNNGSANTEEVCKEFIPVTSEEQIEIFFEKSAFSL